MKHPLALALLLPLMVQLGLAADTKPSAPATSPSTKPTTRPAPAPVVEVQPDGALLLKAEGARIHGFRLHLDPKPIPTIVFWVDSSEYPEWPRAVAKKGT